MARQLLSEQTTTEYFKELVEEALNERQLQASDLTEYYLVNLLCQYVRPDSPRRSPGADEPLAFRLGRALDSGGSEQRARLRSLGDFSLFMSGFFSDSFRRSVVDVDYYKSMGEYAYGSLSRSEHDTFAEVFARAVLQVRRVHGRPRAYQRTDRDHAASAATSLRLYEKWLRTGSVRDGQRLVERGLLPNQSIGYASFSSPVGDRTGLRPTVLGVRVGRAPPLGRLGDHAGQPGGQGVALRRRLRAARDVERRLQDATLVTVRNHVSENRMAQTGV